MKLDTTTLLAFYGSALATIVFLWDIIKYGQHRRRLKVTVRHHVLMGPAARKHMLGIEMANVGKGTITVVASGFKYAPSLPDGNTATIFDPNLPKEIHEGQSYTSFEEPSEVPTDQVVYGWVRDATGRTWRSKRRPLRS